MTAPTLEELAAKHLTKAVIPSGNSIEPDEVIFSGGMDQLRALITEAVGIVQGEVVAWKCLNGTLMEEKPKFIGEPLHHNDLGRLK